MHAAAQSKSDEPDLVSILNAASADISRRDESGCTPLHVAVSHSNINIAQYLLKKGAIVAIGDSSGFTPLHLACSSDKIPRKIVRLLLEYTPDINLRDKEGRTPLHFACINGIAKVVNRLLNGGADKNAVDSTGATPLHYASKAGNLVIIEDLINANVNLNLPDNTNSTPLMYASEMGNADAVKLLLSAGVIVSHGDKEKDVMNRGVLHRAAIGGELKIARMALKDTGETALNARDSQGATPLHTACEKGHFEFADYLIKHGGDVTTRDLSGAYPLHYAALVNSSRCIKVLCKAKGVVADCRDYEQFTPLHRAASLGHAKAALALLGKGAQHSPIGPDGLTPLHIAAAAGHSELCKILVEAGAAVDVADSRKNSALGHASRGGHAGTVTQLIALKAPATNIDSAGNTILHCAVMGGNLDVIKSVLEAAGGASRDSMLKSVNGEGHTPLHVASSPAGAAYLLDLYKGSIGINTPSGVNQDTPVHLACLAGHYALVVHYLNAGCDLSLKNKNGDLPLHSAARSGNADVLKIVLKYTSRTGGADINSLNGLAQTPVYVAIEAEQPACVQILLDHGADLDVHTVTLPTILYPTPMAPLTLASSSTTSSSSSSAAATTTGAASTAPTSSSSSSAGEASTALPPPPMMDTPEIASLKRLSISGGPPPLIVPTMPAASASASASAAAAPASPSLVRDPSKLSSLVAPPPPLIVPTMPVVPVRPDPAQQQAKPSTPPVSPRNNPLNVPRTQLNTARHLIVQMSSPNSSPSTSLSPPLSTPSSSSASSTPTSLPPPPSLSLPSLSSSTSPYSSSPSSPRKSSARRVDAIRSLCNPLDNVASFPQGEDMTDSLRINKLLRILLSTHTTELNRVALSVASRRILAAFVNPLFVSALMATVPTTEADWVSLALVEVYFAIGEGLNLVKYVVEEEVRCTPSPNTLFRGNSLATKILTHYARAVGSPYMFSTLREPISRVTYMRESCEMDPNKLSEGEDLQTNTNHLCSVTSLFLTSITDSLAQAPVEIRDLCACLRETVSAKFPGNAALAGVSGFLFLRFFVPNIVSPPPEHYDLREAAAPCRRTLTLVSKVIQTIANLQEFGAKEAFMTPMNGYVRENTGIIEGFLDKISQRRPSLLQQPTEQSSNNSSSSTTMANPMGSESLGAIYRDPLTSINKLYNHIHNDQGKVLAYMASKNKEATDRLSHAAIEVGPVTLINPPARLLQQTLSSPTLGSVPSPSLSSISSPSSSSSSAATASPSSTRKVVTSSSTMTLGTPTAFYVQLPPCGSTGGGMKKITQ
eukprot:TRINITY_DN4847_c0_g1_i1.p1 TRINITY_DN4847_c0_g1~~TRINITY_DN4847_c0_g1_i1.p1  ORF type:complete len:1286 (-),score=274.34 TRINITY_DN4847_c0_g1_i1:33-3890(-)